MGRSQTVTRIAHGCHLIQSDDTMILTGPPRQSVTVVDARSPPAVALWSRRDHLAETVEPRRVPRGER